MLLSLISLIYLLIFTIFQTRKLNASVRRSDESSSTTNSIQIQIQRKWLNLIYYSLLFLSLLTFEILLCSKLDQDSMNHWISFFRKRFPSSLGYKEETLTRNEISSRIHFLVFNFFNIFKKIFLLNRFFPTKQQRFKYKI